MRRYMYTPCGARVCFCAHVCARVCVSVISVLSIFLRIYANPLYTVYLYTCLFALIFSMWVYLCLFLCAGDAAHSIVCDRVNQSRSLIFHLKRGKHNA